MKCLFTLLLLLIFGSAFPRTLVIGTGSGVVVKNDMNGLHAGDTLAIRSGFYEKGGAFSNLSHISIINYGGLLDFGQTVSLGNLSQVSISGNGVKDLLYGIRFQHMKGSAFFVEAPCNHLSIAFCLYRNLDGIALDASRFFTRYTGDTATMALYKTRLSHQKLLHSGPLFTGSWAGTGSFQNVVDSIAFLNIIIDSSSSEGNQVIGSSVYRMLADHWTITGPTPNGKHDAGIFQTAGNGTLRNIYRRNGWGYLWRLWNVGLNGRTDSYMYNCIDLSSDAYGTIDYRIAAADTTTGSEIPFCRGGNMHILNNTTGNKRNGTHYVSVLVVAGRFFSENGYTLEIRNNLCFNNISDNANRIVKQNTADPLSDTSNNIYVQDPIASGILLDTIECRLNHSGAAIDRAVPVSFIHSDIDGIIRPSGKAADIGAREYSGPGIVEPGRAVIPKKYFYGGLALLFTAVIIFLRKKAVRGKNNQSAAYNAFHFTPY
ncbi:MAG: choice-of-anchor Q domain-containing protein [Chitinophagales bacterium]